jgi:hypothetical protein
MHVKFSFKVFNNILKYILDGGCVFVYERKVYFGSLC